MPKRSSTCSILKTPRGTDRSTALTPYLLALLAIALAWPIPLWLQRAAWPSRAPGPALVLWQAIGISGGLALVTAPLTWGLQPFGTGICSALAELWRIAQATGLSGVLHDDRWHPLGLAAITLGCLLFAHLALTLLHTAYRTFRQRRRHRDFVELLTASLDGALAPQASSTTQTRVLPVEHLLAYCLPGAGRPLTVISQGLINELSTQQLAAVLTHEEAHLTQRHDLLRLAFHAWHKAAPWFPATAVASQEVMELTEILADDAALARHTRADLSAALAHMAQDPTRPEISAAPEAQAQQPVVTSRRLSRLITPEAPLGLGCVSLINIAAVLQVTIPAAISLF